MDTINLTMRQGDTYQHEFHWVDSLGVAIDLTGWTARMQIRKSAGSSAEPLLDLDSEDLTDIYLTLAYATGVVTLEIPAAVTAALKVTDSAAYDIEIEETATEYVETIAEGTVIVQREVTR
jgi:hypothetical protein